MDYFLCFLTLFLSVIGIAAVIRYIVWKITDSKQNEYHYLVFLQDNNAEMTLRGIVERSHFDLASEDRKLYAVDFGLDKMAVSACEKLSNDYPQIIFCKPNQLADYLKN